MSATQGEPTSDSADSEAPAPDSAAARAERDAKQLRFANIVDFILALVLAVSAVGTAWAGFQSSKWSGVQASSTAQANALRTQANRFAVVAGQERTADVVSFTQWLTALNQELGDDPDMLEKVRDYQPEPGTVSGFMYERFREEFKPAVQAWLDTRPLLNPQAPPTPFEMEEYSLAAEAEVAELSDEADGKTAIAAQANQRSDNYVLTTVVFALSLFFAALVNRMKTLRSQTVLAGIAFTAMVAACIVMVTLPIEI